VYVLRNPTVSTHGGNKYNDVQKMTFSGMKLLIPSKSGSWMMIEQVDLTGVAQIDFAVTAPKAMLNAAGGIVEVRLDAPDGPLAGQSKLIEPSDKEGFASDMASAELKGANGIHDVYLIFKNDKSPAGQSLYVVTGIKFQTTAMLAAAVAEQAKGIQLSVASLQAYVGKYKFTGLPFEYITISAGDGVLISDNGKDKGPLKSTSAPDRFDANGQAMFQFVRGADGNVSGVKLEAMGMTFEGKRE
jgi:cytochrome c